VDIVVLSWELPVLEVVHRSSSSLKTKSSKSKLETASEGKSAKVDKTNTTDKTTLAGKAESKTVGIGSGSGSGARGGGIIGGEGAASAAAAASNNVALGVFTTSYARLHLFRGIEQFAEDQLLYCDTDSLLYWHNQQRADHKHIADQGAFTGQWKSELGQDDVITRFCSGGPKNYCYETKQGKKVAKIKGFDLSSYHVGQTLNAAVMRRIVVSGAQAQVEASKLNTDNEKKGKDHEEDADEEMPQQAKLFGFASASGTGSSSNAVQVTTSRVRRDRKRKRVDTIEAKSTYRFLFDKSVVMPDLSTRPFGHWDVLQQQRLEAADFDEPPAKRQKVTR
jgi:hypothetical protein